VRPLVRRAHFFVFPTRFIGEGHSNALNECMAEGVVPVVSDHGANRHVVADAGLVLPPDAAAADYAAAVARIWRAGEWRARSDRCVARIGERFQAGVVMPRLMAAYRAMVSKTARG
jgi:glycosyltransferase involved in cell wall biosynthesis